MMWRTIALVFVLCAMCVAEPGISPSQQLSSEQARLLLTLSPSAPTTAQLITLTIAADLKPGVELGSTSLESALPDGWKIVGVSDSPPRINADQSRNVQRTIRIEPFLPGEFEIKPFEIAFRASTAGPKDAPITLTTEPFKLVVRSVLAPGASRELADLKPAARPPYELPTWAWFAIGGGVVAVGALALIAVAMVRRARRPFIERLTADAHANQRLQALLARDLIQHNQWREHYQGLSDILRGYIEDRFDLAAPERTTDEFLREAKLSGTLTSGDVDVLERFLNHCDMVKFAAMEPDRMQADATLAVVRDFVDRTRTAELQLFVDPRSQSVRRLSTAPDIVAKIQRGEVRT